jgi:hypothetical protein
VSWDAPFDRAVELPDGTSLTTLAEARTYILKLANDSRTSSTAQAAADALIAAAKGVGSLTTARDALVLLVQQQWQEAYLERKS